MKKHAIAVALVLAVVLLLTLSACDGNSGGSGGAVGGAQLPAGDEVRAEHERVLALGGFGVPTIVFPGEPQGDKLRVLGVRVSYTITQPR